MNNSTTCLACGKSPLTKNEVGINKKLLGDQVARFYCLECLASYLEVEVQDILDKIEEFKEDGCKLFS
jgi:biotin operon repressor